MRLSWMKVFVGSFVFIIGIGAATQVTFAQQGKYKLRLAHVFPVAAGQPSSEVCVKYAEMVRKDSNGRLEIEIHGGAVLGGDRAITEQVSLGAIEMANTGVATASQIDKQLAVDELPYIWDSYEQNHQAYMGDFGKIVNQIMLKSGLRALTFWPQGYRHVTNSVRPVRTPDDIKGLKIRVSQVPVRMDAFNELGAKAVPMAFPELFQALQQKAVDGQENPLFLIRDSRFFEVQKHLSLTGHILNSTMLIINEAYYQRLPPDLQAILNSTAGKLQDFIVKMIVENDKLALETLKKEKMQVVENVDISAFRKKLEPVYKKWEKEVEPQTWEALKKYTFIGKQ